MSSSVVAASGISASDLGRRFGDGQRFEDGVEQVADAERVFGGDGEDGLEAEAAVVFGLSDELFGVDLVDGEHDGLAAAQQMPGEVEVGRGEFGAAVDDHDDDFGFVERDAGLAVDLGGNEGFVVGDDAAGVDDAGDAAVPADLAIDAVAGDAGLVADDRAAGLGELVEEGGFADVGASADGEERLVVGGAGLLDGSATVFADFRGAAGSSCGRRDRLRRDWLGLGFADNRAFAAGGLGEKSDWLGFSGVEVRRLLLWACRGGVSAADGLLFGGYFAGGLLRAVAVSFDCFQWFNLFCAEMARAAIHYYRD